jgi:hypothetical protein
MTIVKVAPVSPMQFARLTVAGTCVAGAASRI